MELVEQTVGEFREEVGRTGNVLGTAEGTERILLRIMPPEKVAEIMGDIKGPDSGGVGTDLGVTNPRAGELPARRVATGCGDDPLAVAAATRRARHGIIAGTSRR